MAEKNFKEDDLNGVYVSKGEYTQKYKDLSVRLFGVRIPGAGSILVLFLGLWIIQDGLSGIQYLLTPGGMLRGIVLMLACYLSAKAFHYIWKRSYKAFPAVQICLFYRMAVVVILNVANYIRLKNTEFYISDILARFIGSITGPLLVALPMFFYFYHRQHLFVIGIDKDKWLYYDEKKKANDALNFGPQEYFVPTLDNATIGNSTSDISDMNDAINDFNQTDIPTYHINPFCIKCGNSNLPDSKFCNKCGTELKMILLKCPQCNKDLQDGSTYCRFCGYKLDSNNKRNSNRKFSPLKLIKWFFVILIISSLATGIIYFVNSDTNPIQTIFFPNEPNKTKSLEASIGSDFESVEKYLKNNNISYSEGVWYKTNSINHEKSLVTQCSTGNGYTGVRTYYFDQEELIKIEYIFKDRNSTSSFQTYINLAMNIYGATEYTKAGIDAFVVYGNGERAIISKTTNIYYPVYTITIQ